jgi:hypothetical protein
MHHQTANVSLSQVQNLGQLRPGSKVLNVLDAVNSRSDIGQNIESEVLTLFVYAKEGTYAVVAQVWYDMAKNTIHCQSHTID